MTKTYKELVENNQLIRPQGYERESSDCTIRAFALVSNIPYEEVHKEFEKKGRKRGRGFHIVTTKLKNKRSFKYKREKMDIKKLCKHFGLECKQIARSGTVNRLIKKYPIGNIYCVKRGHCFGIINGNVTDGTSKASLLHNAWLIKQELGEKE